MNKYIIQNDESGKQWAVGPVLKIKPFLSAYIDSKGRISDRYEFDMDDWFSYLIQLPRYEWQGEKREVGDVVVEGLDFKWKDEFVKNDNYDSPVNLNRDTPICGYFSKVAIPLSKAEEVKEKEDDYDVECGLSREDWEIEKHVDKIRELPTLEAIGYLRKLIRLNPSI